MVMGHQEITIRYHVHDDRNTIAASDIRLLQKAEEATKSAYAPYSSFNVGVAILTTDGDIIQGSNQENGAFPIGQCAERVALYRMVHEHGRKPITTIAIVVDNEHQLTPASPCGSCRQILSEYRSSQDHPIRLLLGVTGKDLVYEINDVKDLLPFAFDGSFLGQ